MKKRKLYIVEDEVLVARQLEEYLERENFQVLGTADRAETALAQILETRPELLLLDIRLKKGDDGLQLAEAVQAHLQLPIIFITGCADADTLQRVKRVQPFGYLIKPVIEQQLKVMIELALHQHQYKVEQQLRQELEKITYSLSHTFRGPVASILGITNLCKYEIKDPQALFYNELVDKNIRKLDALLRNYARYSELNRYGTLYLQPIAWEAFWAELFEDMLFPEKNTGQLPVISSLLSNPFYADASLLKTILFPILKNTLDFRRGPTARVHILSREYRDGILLKILDKGSGISRESLERCMELFYRGTVQSSGSGFGLALSCKAVKVAGGYIKMFSKENKGTCVYVYIPDGRKYSCSFEKEAHCYE